MADTGRRGPTEDRGVAMDRIVTVARASFAENGWAGTSVRAVARDAGVDSRLIAYYFTNKSALLQACLQPPVGYLEGIAAVVRTPLRRRGPALVRNLLAAWNNPPTATVLRSIVLTAAHEPVALERLQQVFRNSMIGAVAASLDDDERLVRGGLVASQLVGLSMTRHVWRLEPIRRLPDEDVVNLIGPTIQRYLTGRLPNPTSEVKLRLEVSRNSRISAEESAHVGLRRRATVSLNSGCDDGAGRSLGADVIPRSRRFGTFGSAGAAARGPNVGGQEGGLSASDRLATLLHGVGRHGLHQPPPPKLWRSGVPAVAAPTTSGKEGGSDASLQSGTGGVRAKPRNG